METPPGLSEDIYKSLKLLFNLIGLVINDTTYKLRYIQTLFMCTVFSSCFALSCIGLRRTGNNMDAFISQLTEACSTAFSFCMTCWIAFNKDNICRVFAVLNGGIVKHKIQLSEHQKRLKKTAHNMLKSLLHAMVYTICVMTGIRLVFPFMSGCFRLYRGVEEGAHLPLPIAIWPPITTDTPVKYFAMYLYSTICVLGMSTLYQCVSAILFISIVYARLEIKILADSLLKIEENFKLFNDEREKGLFNGLCSSIQHHQQILSFIKLLNNTFGMTSLFMLGIIGILICLDIYQMSVDSSLFSSTSLSLSGTVVASFIVLWLFSWFGQTLIDEDKYLRAAMYNTKWLEWPKTNKEMLLLMIQRTSHPICIKVAGIQTLNYTTFLSIIQVSYSYYNILHSVQ